MKRDYEALFSEIVIPYLHRLKDLVAGWKRRKVLVHEWLLEVERSCAEFQGTEETSDFVARLSFYLSGLRERGQQLHTEKEAWKELVDTFDAMIYAYFEYGAPDKVEQLAKEFCKKVDNWMKKPVLMPHFERFEKSKENLPLIDEALNDLELIGVDTNPVREHLKAATKKNIEDATSLAEELEKILGSVAELYLTLAIKQPLKTKLVLKELEKFTAKSAKLGHRGVLDERQVKHQEKIEQVVFIIDLAVRTVKKTLLAEYVKIERLELFRKINMKKNVDTIAEETVQELKKQFLTLVAADEKNGGLVAEAKVIQDMWRNLQPTLFSDEEMEELRKLDKKRKPKKKKEKKPKLEVKGLDPTTLRPEPPEEKPKGEKPGLKPPKNIPWKPFVYSTIAIVILLFILFIPFEKSISSTQPTTNLSEKVVNETVVQEVPEPISFQEYSSSPERFNGAEVTLTGFLKHGVKELGGGAGIFTEFLVDDKGLEIELRSLTSREKSYFKEKNTTTELYQVTGKFRYLQNAFIDVDELVPGKRPVTEIKSVVQRKVSQNENSTKDVKEKVQTTLWQEFLCIIN